MSASSSNNIEKKQRSNVTTKCLLNIKTLVTHNLTTNNRKLAPLPLKTEKDSSFETKLSVNNEKDKSIGQKSQGNKQIIKYVNFQNS